MYRTVDGHILTYSWYWKQNLPSKPLFILRIISEILILIHSIFKKLFLQSPESTYSLNSKNFKNVLFKLMLFTNKKKKPSWQKLRNKYYSAT